MIYNKKLCYSKNYIACKNIRVIAGLRIMKNIPSPPATGEGIFHN